MHLEFSVTSSHTSRYVFTQKKNKDTKANQKQGQSTFLFQEEHHHILSRSLTYNDAKGSDQ